MNFIWFHQSRGGDKLDLGKSSYVAAPTHVIISRVAANFPSLPSQLGVLDPLFGGPPSDQFVWCAKTPLIHVAWCSLHHHDDDHHHHQLSLPFKKASLQGPHKVCPGGHALFYYFIGNLLNIIKASSFSEHITNTLRLLPQFQNTNEGGGVVVCTTEKDSLNLY